MAQQVTYSLAGDLGQERKDGGVSGEGRGPSRKRRHLLGPGRQRGPAPQGRGSSWQKGQPGEGWAGVIAGDVRGQASSSVPRLPGCGGG